LQNCMWILVLMFCCTIILQLLYNNFTFLVWTNCSLWFFNDLYSWHFIVHLLYNNCTTVVQGECVPCVLGCSLWVLVSTWEHLFWIVQLLKIIKQWKQNDCTIIFGSLISYCTILYTNLNKYSRASTTFITFSSHNFSDEGTRG
jgi:hypothetical protein